MPLTRNRTSTACAWLAAACAAGCGSRVVLVPEAAPVRLGPNAHARLYTLNAKTGEWELSRNASPLPEGYYLLSPAWVDKEQAHPTEGVE